MGEKVNWTQVYKDWEASGLSVKTYCTTNHICISSFYKNKHVLNDQEADNDDKAFQPISIIEQETITFTINGVNITCNRNDISVFMEIFR